ncbi:hypothetical protein OEZ86_001111 [Tetradesmus obliquus]|nr:hypothetical protein OEZ86_001111 [Tetradesmus obliquus]
MGDCPVAVVSISGPSRQGKSYTLNRLVSAAGGFPVSPGMKPCTHGIWMWPQALEVQGKPHKVLFLDSEGIATKEQSSQAGSTLVALAGVASSLMIANQFNNLNEDSLGHLSVAAAVMRGLFRSTTGSVAAGCQPPCSPPELLFLLRDFNLHSEKTASE